MTPLSECLSEEAIQLAIENLRQRKRNTESSISLLEKQLRQLKFHASREISSAEIRHMKQLPEKSGVNLRHCVVRKRGYRRGETN
jgi:hypothetical protein